MNTFSVSSYDANNQFFSICSKRSIKSVLKAKAKDCFSKPKSTYCGNGIKEKGEECDPGLTNPYGDNCCTKNCRLRVGSQCSDRNHPCCTNCHISSKSKICFDSNELDCKREQSCDGHSPDCEKPNPLEDGTSCAEDGQCLNGECIPFCEKHNLLSCLCDRLEDGCRKCCKTSMNSTCNPFKFSDGDHFHPDGTICLRGFCAKGKCINVTSQDYVERFWSIIDDIEYNSFTTFLKDNLVFVIIVLSLILFVPVCWLIEQYDLKMKDKIEENSREKSQFHIKQHPSSVYGNQSIRTQRDRLPINRQRFGRLPNSSSTERGRKFRRVLDETNCTPNNHQQQTNNSNRTVSIKNSRT